MSRIKTNIEHFLETNNPWQRSVSVIRVMFKYGSHPLLNVVFCLNGASFSNDPAKNLV